MTRLASVLTHRGDSARRGGGARPHASAAAADDGGAAANAAPPGADSDDDLALPPAEGGVAASLLFGSLKAAARKEEKRKKKERKASPPPPPPPAKRGRAGGGGRPDAGPPPPPAADAADDDEAAWAAAAAAPDPSDAFLASSADLTASAVADLDAGRVPYPGDATSQPPHAGLLLTESWGAHARWLATGPVPLPPSVPPSPASLALRPRVASLWAALQGSARRPAFTSPDQAVLLTLLRTYKDVLWPARPYPTSATAPDHLMDAYLVHIASHIVAAAARVRKGNERAAAAEEGDDDAPPPRDQGFARPKALVCLPTRALARRAVLRLASLVQAETRSDSIQGKARFLEDFGDGDEDGSSDEEGGGPKKQPRHPKPADHAALFSGNDDDHFRLGIRVTRGSVRLYSDFETSDVIVASPLGLATHLAGAAEESDKNAGGPGAADFLSGIEIAVLDRADMAAMQNWAHVDAVFSALNRLPEKPPACDVMRVRDAALAGWARTLRQTVILTSHVHPPSAALWARCASSAAGRARLVPSYAGVLTSASPTVQLAFERLPPADPASAADARFAHFTRTVWPRMKAAGLPGQLLFIPSYFDYVRLKKFFKEEGTGIADLGEYVEPRAAARARTAFAKNTAGGGRDHALPRLALLTERAHFYHRSVVRGVRDALFYQLPDHEGFYAEVVGWVGAKGGGGGGAHAPTGGRAVALFSALDALALERVAGSSRARRMLKGSEPAFVFC